MAAIITKKCLCVIQADFREVIMGGLINNFQFKFPELSERNNLLRIRLSSIRFVIFI